MSVIKKIDKEGVVAYKTAYAKIPGSDPMCALLLSQVCYWCAKMDDGVAWITHQAMFEQTGMTRKQQDRAAEFWISAGVISKFVKGIPPKIHYFVDFDALEALITKSVLLVHMSETDIFDVQKAQHVMSERDKTSIIDSIDSKRLFTVAALPTCVHSQQSENAAVGQSEAPTQTQASSKTGASNDLASSIYALYPRKVAKAAALKAIKKALVENPDIDIPEAVKEYAKATATWKEDDKRFIPYPASWFNGGCFMDDRAEWWKKSVTAPAVSRGRKI